jgi:hypothetical protein
VGIGEDGKGKHTLNSFGLLTEAADLARSFGGEIGGMIMGGFLSVAILCNDEDQVVNQE